MKVLILYIAILLAGCAPAPVKGCGYARSQIKEPATTGMQKFLNILKNA